MISMGLSGISIGFQSNSVGFRGISWGKPLGKKTDKVEKHHGFLAIGIHLGAQWEVGGGIKFTQKGTFIYDVFC